jgi:hypothetical protein
MGYEPQSNPKSSPPFVRKVNSNVMIQEDEGSPPSDKLWRPINKSKQSGTFAIRFTLVDENDHFSELSKYYLQASFDDALSTARPFQTID